MCNKVETRMDDIQRSSSLTNFQDLVAKVKNLVALAISCPFTSNLFLYNFKF